jgi:hypothetical protein
MAFRLSHPRVVLGCVEDALQMAGELLAAGAGIAAAVHLRRNRPTPRPGD